MRGTITKWSGLVLAGALALSVLALAACGGGDSTNSAPNGGNQAGASGLANLLNSTSGAAVYEQLLQAQAPPPYRESGLTAKVKPVPNPIWPS
jgi:hypothetical protein